MGRAVRGLVVVALVAPNLVAWPAETPAFAAVTTQVAAATIPLPNGAMGGTANSVSGTLSSPWGRLWNWGSSR